MMHSIVAAVVSALAIGAAARPATNHPTRDSGSCMSTAEAQQVAQNFADLINLPFNTTLANDALCSDFHDYSDSVSELIDVSCLGKKTLGQATFTSRADFISSQSGQPPIPFQILKIWPSCQSLTMRWQSSAPGSKKPEDIVTGIVVMEVVENSDESSDQPWVIETVYSEFNSGAWLYDLNLLNSSCATTKRSPSTPARRSIHLRSAFDGPSRLF